MNTTPDNTENAPTSTHALRRDDFRLIIEALGFILITISLLFTGVQLRYSAIEAQKTNNLLALQTFVPRVAPIASTAKIDDDGTLVIHTRYENLGPLPVRMTTDFFYEIATCGLVFGDSLSPAEGSTAFSRTQRFGPQSTSYWITPIKNINDNLLAHYVRFHNHPKETGRTKFIIRFWRIVYAFGQERFDFLEDIEPFGDPISIDGTRVSLPKIYSRVSDLIELNFDIHSPDGTHHVSVSDERECIPADQFR